MTISSWDAVYYLGVSIGMELDDIHKVSLWLMPDDSGKHDIDDFIRDAAIGLDKKSLVVGAMLSSIIMNRVYITSDGEDVVRCIVCGNQNPVNISDNDGIGWVCSDCSDAYDKIRRRIESSSVEKCSSVEKPGIISNLCVMMRYRLGKLWRNER